MKGNYAWSNETRSLNYGVSGGILLHSEGVTFSQEMGETVALVKAPERRAWRWKTAAVSRRTGAATP